MLELPEVLTIAKQMNDELRGKRIEAGNRGNTPHKWVFYNRSADEFEQILAAKAIREVTGDRKWIFVPLEPGYVLLLGDMGGRILYHKSEETLPKKYHLMLRFEDHTYLTVAIQGWGFIQIVEKSGMSGHLSGKGGISPLRKEFTYERFNQILENYEEKEKKSIKAFTVSSSGISGIGNGYLQDILFGAKIHPTRKVGDITGRERQKLYDAIRKTMEEAIELGGRDDERDLYNNPGKYRRILDSRSRGRPCPVCGTTIEKIQYLGGASYFCPSCQK